MSADQFDHERFAALSRRLRPDFENKPLWVQEEMTRLADRSCGLPPEARARAVADNMSERLRRYYQEESIAADIAAVSLLDGTAFNEAEDEREGSV